MGSPRSVRRGLSSGETEYRKRVALRFLHNAAAHKNARSHEAGGRIHSVRAAPAETARCLVAHFAVPVIEARVVLPGKGEGRALGVTSIPPAKRVFLLLLVRPAEAASAKQSAWLSLPLSQGFPVRRCIPVAGRLD